MDIPWEDLRLFLAVAETGSLSRAARRLGTTQPTVSRKLAELEAALGDRLFTRTALGAVPTAFGERLREPARRMAEWAAEFERTAEQRAVAPHGIVRITAPPGVAFDFAAPFASWLRGRLPEVRLEVVSSIHYLDLARREADLALRTQKPSQRDLVTVATLDHPVVAYAAADYAAKLGPKPKLADVAWLGWAPPHDHLPPNPELAALIPGFRPSFASDDFLVLLRAAELGLGAIFLGRARHRFARPTNLVELDLPLPPRRAQLHLVAAKSALDVPRIRAVADLLAAELARTETGPVSAGSSRSAPSRAARR